MNLEYIISYFLYTHFPCLICRELHLEDINEDNITLWKQREAYTFERVYDVEAGHHYRFGDESLTILDEGVHIIGKAKMCY